MKLTTFVTGGRQHVGVVDTSGQRVVDLTVASDGAPAFSSMLELIQSGPEALAEARRLQENAAAHAVHELADVQLRAPLPDPVRLRDCSLFIEHLQPAFRGMARKLAQQADDPDAEYDRLVATGRFDTPEVFSREVIYYNADHLAISGPEDVIVAPAETRRLDYELEFAAVLGTTGRDFTAETAMSSIFGYTLFNDWSCRDLQSTVMESQLGPSRGKDFDGSNTLGPFIVTPDELESPYSIELSARVNGERWSHGTSASMHHSFSDAITHFSRGRTVYAGEVIGTGTVLSGSPVEIGRELANGDVVELEASGIGVLRNRVELSY